MSVSRIRHIGVAVSGTNALSRWIYVSLSIFANAALPTIGLVGVKYMSEEKNHIFRMVQTM